MTTASQAIEQRDDKADAMIAAASDDFALVLPSQIDSAQWVRTAQGVVRRDPKLLAAARKNPASFMSAMLKCAHYGLEPGDTFHLVPFGQEVTGIVDYKGHIELMYRAGHVGSVTAQIVYAGDKFDYNPASDRKPHHKPTQGWFSPRGEMVGAYAYADMRSGAVSQIVIMDEAEINKHKAESKNKALWEKWPKSMWLKTVVKELQKWVPTSAEDRTVERSSTHRPPAPISDPPVTDDSADEFPNDDEPVDAEVVEDET